MNELNATIKSITKDLNKKANRDLLSFIRNTNANLMNLYMLNFNGNDQLTAKMEGVLNKHDNGWGNIYFSLIMRSVQTEVRK